ncbi:MAG: DUF5116 domain-containing protein [Flavobacterium sp. BFFFF1]|uniref:SusF/SusE family outer membrane protein n=1 Tax=Flavobacterium sp. BFFFF1 TaxID=2015557 RepID=UPI000BD4199E|nr:SusE domain-containing protein [Flavobacterium sp. BFFFF1]OYU82184.1 MAG: DUF5116 domain-containing protein [Flavobacterium sp. BFFFF1]
MKNTFKILAAFIMISGLWSCASEDNFMIAEPQANAFAILTPDSGSAVTITETTPADNTALTLTWEGVDYGTPTAVNYTVEFALNGTDFATPTVITTVPATRYAMTFADLDAKAKALVVTPDAPYNGDPIAIDVRIKSSIGTTASEEKYSEVTTVVVNSFIPTVPPVLEKRELYFVGPASSAGWNNNNDNMPMFRDANNDDLYVYTGKFVADQFKLLEKKGQWQPQWGISGGILAVNDGTGSDPDPFVASGNGYYTFTVDVANNTFDMTPFAGNTATTIPTIGIIGDGTAGGWDTDTDMTQSSFDPHVWKITATLVDGFMKFRANNDWPVNWGSGTATSGVGVQDGSNIPVTAGTYDIWFNDLDGRYLLIPQQ